MGHRTKLIKQNKVWVAVYTPLTTCLEILQKLCTMQSVNTRKLRSQRQKRIPITTDSGYEKIVWTTSCPQRILETRGKSFGKLSFAPISPILSASRPDYDPDATEPVTDWKWLRCASRLSPQRFPVAIQMETQTLVLFCKFFSPPQVSSLDRFKIIEFSLFSATCLMNSRKSEDITRVKHPTR